MTDFTRYEKDGSSTTGVIHPEVAEASLACLKRDLRKLRHLTKGESFIRKPYADLQEAQMIGINENAPAPKDIVAVIVIPVVKGDTNARLPVKAEQLEEQLAKNDLIDLWSTRGFG